MTEQDFISLIDCRFPYDDFTEAERLITVGAAISINAAFMVVEELTRVPASISVTTTRRLELLQLAGGHFEHPLKALILDIAEQVMRGSGLSLPQTIGGMHAVAAFPNQYCALSVVYSAADQPWEEIDRLYELIVEQWSKPADQRFN